MRINTRLAVAIHILSLIELNNYKDIPNTSENLALSVGTNPVVVRRIIAMLKRANLVDVRAGVGGASLLHNPKDITLLDVYNALRAEDDAALFGKHETSNRNCYVGAYILDVIDEPLYQAQKAMEDKLESYSVYDAIAPIAEKNGMVLE